MCLEGGRRPGRHAEDRPFESPGHRSFWRARRRSEFHEWFGRADLERTAPLPAPCATAVIGSLVCIERNLAAGLKIPSIEPTFCLFQSAKKIYSYSRSAIFFDNYLV